MTTFQVGEIAIAVNSVDYPETNGHECEIIGGLMSRTGNCGCVCNAYDIRMDDGEEFFSAPENLRKLPPDVKTTWEDSSVWKPKELVYA